jgi:N-acetylneuraminic acid mutarotase
VWEYLPISNTWVKKVAFTENDAPLQLMYAAAINYGSAHIVVFGGDDGKEFIRRSELEKKIAATDDEQEKETLKAELAEAFTSHKGFCNKMFAYHPITDTWTTASSRF